ncbi:MAG TPA: SAM-dependent chlorinase/fluorinase [Terriglobales bacterium]|nr:SAM-dependent chlorinase/fluorinase [Terriglobales bacterium]
MTLRFTRQNTSLAIVFLLALVSTATAQVQKPSQKYPPTVVLMTDFGTVDDSVAICKGVMYSILPDLRIVDLTQQVTPFSILDGARFLYGATPYYPARTVFVVVVDPTVGSSRKAIVAKSKHGQYFVLPDNGLLTMVQDRDGIEGVHEITNRNWMIGAALSSTFHGRDIFSPVGAHLANGEDWTQVGPPLETAKLVRLDLAPSKLDEHGLTGTVIATDGPFGNLITNISGEDFLQFGYKYGEKVNVTIGEAEITLPFVHTFSDVPLKKPLLYIDSRGHLALAVNQGSFAEIYGITLPMPIVIPHASK